MNENQNTHIAEIPVGGKQGFIWNRLHEEREEITEAIVKVQDPNSRTHPSQDVLEARLHSIDEALDRMMSGSYGTCALCGHLIEEATLDVDPAWTKCLGCWSKEAYSASEYTHGSDESSLEVDLETVDAFDTILLRTLNSEYRIFMLDPKACRALVEGGSYLVHPLESFLMGTATPGSDDFKRRTISVGGSVKIWVDDKILSTSPIKSFEVKRNGALAESLVNIQVGLSSKECTP